MVTVDRECYCNGAHVDFALHARHILTLLCATHGTFLHPAPALHLLAPLRSTRRTFSHRLTPLCTAHGTLLHPHAPHCTSPAVFTPLCTAHGTFLQSPDEMAVALARGPSPSQISHRKQTEIWTLPALQHRPGNGVNKSSKR